MQKEDDIITFATYYDPMQAQIMRTKFEDRGIHCFITDQNMGVMAPYNQAIGGIKLKIFARDLEQCETIAAEKTDNENLEETS